jgi:sugar lactone lactonase YvrE
MTPGSLKPYARPCLPRIPFLLVLLLAGGAGCDPPTPPPITSYNLPDNAFPEGIAVDEEAGVFYASSLSQGTIFRGNLTEPNAGVFLPGGIDGRTITLGLNLDLERKRLFVCGGHTGMAFVYDTNDGRLLGRFSTGVTPTADFQNASTLLNDVAVLPSGDAFFTDSAVPILFRLPVDAVGQSGPQTLEPWLDFTGTPLVYQTEGPNFLDRVNANGLIATEGGQYLIVLQTNTGKVFRVTVSTKEVVEITGVSFPVGGGIVLGRDNVAYGISPRPALATISFAANFTSGIVADLPNMPTDLLSPSAAALAGNRLLVVNSQIDKFLTNAEPVTPFTIRAISLP